MRMRDDDGHHAMLAAGKAWKRVKLSQKRLWSDWTMEIGPGLMKARAEAMSVADTNQPMGRGYNTAMADLLKEYQLDDMGETARAHMLKIMERLADVEEWRAKQKNPSDLNHPSRVWTAYQRHASKARDEQDREKRKTSPAKETEGQLAVALEENEQLKARIDELSEELAGAREGVPVAGQLTVSDDVEAICGFCGKTNEQVEVMVASSLKSEETKLCICNECVPLVVDIVRESKARRAKSERKRKGKDTAT